MKMRPIREIDPLNMKILRELSVNGRISVTDLAAKIGLSKTPCLARMRRLETQGYIRGYRAVIDPTKVGLGHIAFVEVKLSDTTDKALNVFNAAVRNRRPAAYRIDHENSSYQGHKNCSAPH